MDEILNRIDSWARDGNPIAPGMWIDEAMRLMSFYGQESDRLFLLERIVATEKWKRIEAGESDAKAESYKRTLPEYVEMKRQEARVKRIDEYVRLAKKRATLAGEEFNL